MLKIVVLSSLFLLSMSLLLSSLSSSFILVDAGLVFVRWADARAEKGCVRCLDAWRSIASIIRPECMSGSQHIRRESLSMRFVDGL